MVDCIIFIWMTFWVLLFDSMFFTQFWWQFIFSFIMQYNSCDLTLNSFSVHSKVTIELNYIGLDYTHFVQMTFGHPFSAKVQTIY